jgi:2-amino-4-hydroxy-6-hydroxymethyldihydropteridine diphosphokinase
MAEVLLLLGGNVGDVKHTLHQASIQIRARIGRVLATSRDHWTTPWGFSDERLFLDQALLVDTAMAPEDVMHACLAIEQDLGRVRSEAPAGKKVYEARTIDIDVLMIGDRIMRTELLELPHPRMHERAFALSPAADVVPGWEHPVLHRSVLSLLHDVKQRS